MSFAAREDTGILNTFGRVCAGCTASVCALTLTNPLDVIKVSLNMTVVAASNCSVVFHSDEVVCGLGVLDAEEGESRV